MADAMGIRDVLVERYGFKPERIRMLLNADATEAASRAHSSNWRARPVPPTVC